MSKTVTPQPMPTTGMPDRVDPANQPKEMRPPVQFGRMSVNPGKPPSAKDGK
jgi:hypothetical protein